MTTSSRKEDLGFLLVIISRRYRSVLDEALSEFGLTDAATMPLRYLARLNEGIRQKDLAEILDIEGPTLVRALDQLVEMGLVERSECPDDRRAKLVNATRKGRDLHASFNTKLNTLRDGIFNGASSDDIDASLRLLKTVESNLQPDRSGNH